MGTVKKTALDEFSNPRKAGIIAVDLDAGDYLIGAALTDGAARRDAVFSDGGKAVRFDENDVRPMGRNARGVRGMSLEEGQSVIAMLVADGETTADSAEPNARNSVLTATENGLRKAHQHQRIHTPRSWHQGHDRHPAKRAQRQGGCRHARARR
jgi:DNA gyrase subunit A